MRSGSPKSNKVLEDRDVKVSFLHVRCDIIAIVLIKISPKDRNVLIEILQEFVRVATWDHLVEQLLGSL